METQANGEGSNLYRVLGIEPDATPDQIKRAYRKKAVMYHPDKNPGHEEEVRNYCPRSIEEIVTMLPVPRNLGGIPNSIRPQQARGVRQTWYEFRM